MSARACRGDPFARIAPYYDSLMASVPYQKWTEYVAQLAALAGAPVEPGCHLLDLATGTGSVALEFAAQGCRVTGVDCSEPMLAEARRKIDARGLSVTLLCSDLRNLHLPPNFDHAVCLYDSLNYVLQPRLLEQTFDNTARALKPGGLFIFDVNTVHALQAELFTQSSPEGAPVTYRWLSRYHPRSRTSRITMHFQIPATGDSFTVVHRQRAYPDDELQSLLRAAGFSEVAVYEAYEFNPPTAKTDRAFYVARVPDPASPDARIST
jgi:ubiquinone/menaquinone biosynthesis C-methylase UbiE